MLAHQTLATTLITNEIGWVFIPGDPASIRARDTPVPLQAAICDIIGAGIVSDVTKTNETCITRIEVDNYWTGNPGSNTLFVVSHTNPPVDANIPILFFVNSYPLPSTGLGPSESRFLLAFNHESFKRAEERRKAMFLDGERSWFHCIPENSDFVAFASNLVVAAQISTNLMSYYEIIRDGERQNPPLSQIRIDSEMSLWNCRYWMTTNFMWQIWDDPKLYGNARHAINNGFYSKTRSFFPRQPQF